MRPKKQLPGISSSCTFNLSLRYREIAPNKQMANNGLQLTEELPSK